MGSFEWIIGCRNRDLGFRFQTCCKVYVYEAGCWGKAVYATSNFSNREEKGKEGIVRVRVGWGGMGRVGWFGMVRFDRASSGRYIVDEVQIDIRNLICAFPHQNSAEYR